MQARRNPQSIKAGCAMLGMNSTEGGRPTNRRNDLWSTSRMLRLVGNIANFGWQWRGFGLRKPKETGFELGLP